MPELPDVEGFRRTFARRGAGRRIRDVVIPDRSIVRNASPEETAAALDGRRLERPQRHGKWLVAPAEGPALLVHFGMTGDLLWGAGSDGRHPHDRAILVLDDGELRYRNMRRFGGLWLARDEQERNALLEGLGPDAMRVSRARFLDLLARRRGRIKPVLMDQSLIAGVGNLVADETLWSARIAPTRPVEQMTDEERSGLFDAMRDVLRRSVRRGIIPAESGWFAEVRGEPGARCPRCGTTLSRAAVGGRTTYWCEQCQRG